jgi:hypothetical protein
MIHRGGTHGSGQGSRQGGGQGEAPDAMYPHLSRDRADALREEVMRTLHERGFDTSWRPDGYIAASHPGEPAARIIGLDNLALQIARSDPDDRDLAAHVHEFITAMLDRTDPDQLSQPDFLRLLKVRLVNRDALSLGDETDYTMTTRPFTDDLVVSLVSDTPTTIVTLPDRSLDDRGVGDAEGHPTAHDLDDLWRVGYRNLWQELVDADVTVEHIRGAEAGAQFRAVESPSFFLSSAPLFLDELLDRWIPDLDTSRGVMVAVPHRHLMLVREVTTGHDLLNGINIMTSAAVTQFTENPGPVSATLHLFREGAEVLPFTEITTNDDGQRVIQVYPDDYLMECINGDDDGESGEDHTG